MEPGFDFKNVDTDTLNAIKIDIPRIVNAAVDSVVSVTEARNFQNTVQPIIDAERIVQTKEKLVSFVNNFYPSKELRELALEIEKEIKKFFIDTFLRRDFYRSFLDYYTNQFNNDKEEKKLTNDEIRYVNHQMRDFKRNGLHLEENDYQEVKMKLKEISEICTQYSNNINEEVTQYEISKEELAGLPSHFFDEEKLLVKDEGV
jgi:Zn-dependent oligopeptidase